MSASKGSPALGDHWYIVSQLLTRFPEILAGDSEVSIQVIFLFSYFKLPIPGYPAPSEILIQSFSTFLWNFVQLYINRWKGDNKMTIKIKPNRNKTLTIKITQEEHNMVQALRAKKIDYPQMIRDLIEKTYEETK